MVRVLIIGSMSETPGQSQQLSLTDVSDGFEDQPVLRGAGQGHVQVRSWLEHVTAHPEKRGAPTRNGPRTLRPSFASSTDSSCQRALFMALESDS